VTAVKKPAFTVSADDFKALCAALGAEPSQELANAMDQFAGQKKKLKKAGVEDLFNDMVKHKGDVRVVGLRTGEKTDAYGFREGSVHSKAIAALTKTPLKMKDWEEAAGVPRHSIQYSVMNGLVAAGKIAKKNGGYCLPD
jgi:hypothetical protein